MVASPVPAGTASRWARMRASLTPAEWRRAAVLAAVIVGLHVVGIGLLTVSGALGVGVGITAYTLGLRHAFDADHIAAIDNTTRKLMGEGQRPLSRRLLLLARALVDRVRARPARRRRRARRGRQQHGRHVTGVLGPVVSGTFLLLIGVLNLLVLVSITKIFRRMRAGAFDEAALEDQLQNRGLLNRFYGRATRAVSQALAHVPARPPVRARVRHRHRGRAARPRRHRRRRAACPSTRSSACRSCSPPACRCSTRSTARS